MATNKYTTYYNYLHKGWNKTFANYIINAEKKGEEKFGIDTIGIVKLSDLNKNYLDYKGCNLYMPVPYNILNHFFKKVNLNDCNHLLDIGCGKGRVMCVAASYGAKKITGLDFSKTLIDAASQNIEIVQKQFLNTKFSLVVNNAFHYKIPTSVDCVFLFNPFNETVMRGVIHNILKSLQKKPRQLTVIYICPEEKQLFTEVGFEETYYYKALNYLTGSILTINNSN